MDFWRRCTALWLFLDGAILVISAKDGVQAQTRILFHALRKMNIPTVIFINKIDQAGVDLQSVVQSVRDKLSADIIIKQTVSLSPEIVLEERQVVQVHGQAQGVQQGGQGGLTAIVADSVRRAVYVGSRSGDLFRVAGERLDRLTPRGAKPGRIRSLAADSHGVVWVTTPEAGIIRYRPESNDYKHFRQEPYTVSYNLDTLTRIAEGGGRLWIKMNQYGFGCYDREKDVVEPFYNDPRQPDCLMTNAVVRFDVHGNVLWLSTYYERGLRKAVLLDQPAEIITLDAPSKNALRGEVRALLKDSRGACGWVRATAS